MAATGLLTNRKNSGPAGDGRTHRSSTDEVHAPVNPYPPTGSEPVGNLTLAEPACPGVGGREQSLLVGRHPGDALIDMHTGIPLRETRRLGSRGRAAAQFDGLSTLGVLNPSNCGDTVRA